MCGGKWVCGWRRYAGVLSVNGEVGEMVCSAGEVGLNLVGK